MSGSLLRLSLVTRTLLRQNRILITLLLLWPFALSAILLIVAHGRPAVEDAAAILQQELFYGLVLVGLGASVALGTEQKARRTQQMLGRALSRTEYLLALGASALLPFLGYIGVWFVNALVFAGLMRLHMPALLPPLGAELAAGFLLCCVGLLLSVLLPQIAAAVVLGALVAAGFAAGVHGLPGVARLFATVSGMGTSAAMPGRGVLEGVLSGVIVAAVAALIFAWRDLKLN